MLHGPNVVGMWLIKLLSYFCTLMPLVMVPWWHCVWQQWHHPLENPNSLRESYYRGANLIQQSMLNHYFVCFQLLWSVSIIYLFLLLSWHWYNKWGWQTGQATPLSFLNHSMLQKTYEDSTLPGTSNHGKSILFYFTNSFSACNWLHVEACDCSAVCHLRESERLQRTHGSEMDCFEIDPLMTE